MIVAVDASTDRLSVAAGSPGGRTVERSAIGARRHGGLLVPLVEECLAEIGASLDHLSALAVSDGPGSFTGLRVAIAWAKGVSRVRAIPIWTASTLLVRAVAAEGPGRTVVGVQSALRGEWFAAGYRFGDGGVIETVVEPMVLGPADSVARFGRVDAVVGDGVADAVASRFDAPVVVGPPGGLPDARRLIELVGRSGGAAVIADPAHWEPSYGRPAEAQAKWEREHGRSLPDPAGHGR